MKKHPENTLHGLDRDKQEAQHIEVEMEYNSCPGDLWTGDFYYYHCGLYQWS